MIRLKNNLALYMHNEAHYRQIDGYIVKLWDRWIDCLGGVM